MLKKKLLAMLLSISICSTFATTSGVFATTDEQQDTNPIEFISKDFESGVVKTESIDLTDFSATETFGNVGETISQPIMSTSGGGGISTHSIIGEDNAYEILNTNVQPYQSICHIVTYWDTNGDGVSDFTSGGTGFMQKLLQQTVHTLYSTD